MTLLDSLKKIVNEKDILIKESDKAYACLDRSTAVAKSMPLMVVRVQTTIELTHVVEQCLTHRTPIVIRGAGTGKSGGAVADNKSVVIDITRLNRILSIDSANLLAEVEPGVVLSDLQETVMAQGLFYPPDPASAHMCTIGGNVAENAAGPSTLKYGTTRDYVLGGQAILGTGEICEFGKRCPKGVAGYDIAALLCGSEGTLAVFTKLVLRLLPLPKEQALAMFFFDDEKKALLLVNKVLQGGHLPKTLEYVDHICLMSLSRFSGYKFPKEARGALIIECDASYKGGAKKQIKALAQMLKSRALIKTLFALTKVSRQKLWHLRSLLSEACAKYLGYKLSEDIAVPLGALCDFRTEVKALAKPPHVLCGLFGHAGDGNLHVQILFDDLQYKDEVEHIRHQILLLVLRLGGTLAAEHGIGLQKKAYLPYEQALTLIELQKRIKKAFDPHNLLNPGKIFDV